MKRKLISLVVVAALILAMVGVILLLPDGGEVYYGIKSGSVTFSEEGTDISDLVLGGAGYTAAKNDNFTLLLDKNANPVIIHSKSGREWRAAPADSADASKLSALDIAYYYDNGRTVLHSSDSAVAKDQVRITQLENGVRVEYIFGDMQEDFVFPEQISEERMNQLLEKMSEEDAEYIGRRYTLYKLELAEGANRDFLLSQYPRLAEENLYILTDMPNQNIKRRTDEIFRSIGYTAEDRDRDNSGAGGEQVFPRAFRAAVDYTLTNSGFKASVDFNDVLFYSDYPLTELALLPNFGAFSPDESGYCLLPSGSGALVYADGMASAQEISYSLPVYGQNSTVTRQMDTTESVCTLPVFGQYKGGSGFLCILEDGAEQAELRLMRSADGMTLSPVYETIDNGVHQMQQKADTLMFASECAVERVTAEYVLFPQLAADSAYSEMANYYRGYLEDTGVLNGKVDSDDPSVLASVVSSLEYDDLLAGLIPVKREYALTTFSQAEDIITELSEEIGGENLKVLLSGWNKNGLNAQKPGSVKVSGAAGGRRDLEQLLEAADKNGVDAFVNLEFVMTEPEKLFAYFPVSNSARALNNSVANLSVLDPIYCSWQETGRQLVSPLKYEQLWESYSSKADFKGIGVSQLSSMLCGDYANGSAYTRGETLKTVTDILSSMKSEHSILGSGGNLYALPYLSYVDGLSTSSDGQSFFDCDVPFVQMVLHGHVRYCAEDINSALSEKELLQLIESGSDLRCTLTANEFDRIYETDFSMLHSTRYETVGADVIIRYEKLSEALGGLADKLMTGHRRISDDVVCVTYENGTDIYINYGDKDFNIDGLTVPAEDFIRVDS